MAVFSKMSGRSSRRTGAASTLALGAGALMLSSAAFVAPGRMPCPNMSQHVPTTGRDAMIIMICLRCRTPVAAPPWEHREPSACNSCGFFEHRHQRQLCSCRGHGRGHVDGQPHQGAQGKGQPPEAHRLCPERPHGVWPGPAGRLSAGVAATCSSCQLWVVANGILLALCTVSKCAAVCGRYSKYYIQ